VSGSTFTSVGREKSVRQMHGRLYGQCTAFSHSHTTHHSWSAGAVRDTASEPPPVEDQRRHPEGLGDMLRARHPHYLSRLQSSPCVAKTRVKFGVFA